MPKIDWDSQSEVVVIGAKNQVGGYLRLQFLVQNWSNLYQLCPRNSSERVFLGFPTSPKAKGLDFSRPYIFVVAREGLEPPTLRV